MYGEGRNIRYFVGLGLLIVLLFVVIFLIISHGGDDNKVAETKRELTSYVDDSDVTITQTMISPITAAQTHNQLEISVTNSGTNADVSTGYDGNVTASRSYPMSNASFGEFLNSLERAGFTKGDTSEELKNDQGYCPTGFRYVYTIREGAKEVQRFWATGCGGTRSYKGNLNLTINLFRAQVPDYGDLVNNTSL